MSWARGSKAYGFCDRTGFRYPLSELKEEIVNGTPTGSRIGADMVDKDHPQNFVGRVLTDDPKPLKDPRPDTALDESRAIFGWRPVGIPYPYTCLTAHVGVVTVDTGG